MQVDIDDALIPAGWKLTGEFRKPVKGETVLMGARFVWTFNDEVEDSDLRLIVRRKPRRWEVEEYTAPSAGYVNKGHLYPDGGMVLVRIVHEMLPEPPKAEV